MTSEKISDERRYTSDERKAANAWLYGQFDELPVPDREQWKIAAHALKLNRELQQARAELAAMTEDRDLWQYAHDDECPNKALLESTQEELAALRSASEELAKALESLLEIANETYTYKFVRGEGYVGAFSDGVVREARAALDSYRQVEA